MWYEEAMALGLDVATRDPRIPPYAKPPVVTQPTVSAVSVGGTGRMTNKTMIAGAGIGGAVHVARWVASKAGKPIELIKANWNNPQFWTSAGMTTAISAAMEGGDFPGGIPFKPSNGTGNGMGPLPDSVATRTWTPFIGGPTFTRYDGLGGTRIAVTRKNGTIKVYRPYHPVVIPKRWNTSSMRRVDRSMKRLQ
jgi:hypothetical protein